MVLTAPEGEHYLTKFASSGSMIIIMEILIDSDGIMEIETHLKDRNPTSKGRVCSSVRRGLWPVKGRGDCLTDHLLKTRGASDYKSYIKNEAPSKREMRTCSSE